MVDNWCHHPTSASDECTWPLELWLSQLNWSGIQVQIFRLIQILVYADRTQKVVIPLLVTVCYLFECRDSGRYRRLCENSTHSLTAALDQLRVVASSTSNDPGPRSRQHQQWVWEILINLTNHTVTSRPSWRRSMRRRKKHVMIWGLQHINQDCRIWFFL